MPSQTVPSVNPDTLPAGRELDALIAEHVMGWTHEDEKSPTKYWCDSLGYLAVLPFYSTNIVPAWLVVEKLRNSVTLYGPQAAYAGGEYVNQTDFWIAEVAGWASAEAETPALAICRAALRSVVGY